VRKPALAARPSVLGGELDMGLAAQWRGIEQVREAVAARTGQVLITRAPAPGAGWPGSGRPGSGRRFR
jgi:hypothetical protein